VSGPHGSGELMRCLIIARELRRADPGIDVRFLVSRDAVFRDAVNFPIIDCDASPTRSTPQVLAAIESFRPHVMVFDNSGRTEQLRAAKRAGAKLVFTSRAPRLRWKAFRLKWMRLLDEHWLVFPAFVTGALTPLERLKLKFVPGYRVRHFDTFFTPTEAGARQAWLAGCGLEPGQFTVFIPGGRGEQHKAADPAGLFVDAAREFVAATGRVAVVLTGSTEPLASVAAESSGLRLFSRISGGPAPARRGRVGRQQRRDLDDSRPCARASAGRGPAGQRPAAAHTPCRAGGGGCAWFSRCRSDRSCRRQFAG
jgi:hypothetical protein